MYVNGRSTFVAADDSPYKYDWTETEYWNRMNVNSILLPVFRYMKPTIQSTKVFREMFYLSFIEMGTDEYEPWNTGVSLGSVYTTGGIQKTYKYIYTGAGDFTITAVATNVGDKDYKGIDYSEERSNSLDDYSHKRALSSVKVSVKP